MTKYRIWRYDAETSYAEVEAEDEDAALALVQDGDDTVTWVGTRYDADYEVEEVEDAPDTYPPGTPLDTYLADEGTTIEAFVAGEPEA